MDLIVHCGTMLCALVLHKFVTSIEVDDDCLHLILEAWYRVLAGERSAVICALHLIEELGPYLGLHINFSKCELFSRNGNSHFPPVVASSLLPNLDILGVLIGDFVHCSHFIAEKCATPKTLLKALVDISAVNLHVAFFNSPHLFDEEVGLQNPDEPKEAMKAAEECRASE
ncbi:hypothetical protein EMCRGX_G030115 [Ephydatia muelleri]